MVVGKSLGASVLRPYIGELSDYIYDQQALPLFNHELIVNNKKGKAIVLEINIVSFDLAEK